MSLIALLFAMMMMMLAFILSCDDDDDEEDNKQWMAALLLLHNFSYILISQTEFLMMILVQRTGIRIRLHCTYKLGEYIMCTQRVKQNIIMYSRIVCVPVCVSIACVVYYVWTVKNKIEGLCGKSLLKPNRWYIEPRGLNRIWLLSNKVVQF